MRDGEKAVLGQFFTVWCASPCAVAFSDSTFSSAAEAYADIAGSSSTQEPILHFACLAGSMWDQRISEYPARARAFLQLVLVQGSRTAKEEARPGRNLEEW